MPIVTGFRKLKSLVLVALAAVFGGLAWYLTKRVVILIAPIYAAAPVRLLAAIVVCTRRPTPN